MLLNDVVNDNHILEKTNVNSVVNDFEKLIKEIQERKREIQKFIVIINKNKKLCITSVSSIKKEREQ